MIPGYASKNLRPTLFIKFALCRNLADGRRLPSKSDFFHISQRANLLNQMTCEWRVLLYDIFKLSKKLFGQKYSHQLSLLYTR